jgi:diaminohydroxyphosphoribosylaminopyrimidine deaminase/5-amino-6-(5-phosphoribosylamino)uracil reductase
MASEQETAAMRRAVSLAREALGRSNPNPAVGAVVIDSTGTEVGSGSTQQVGGAHAEVVALAAAGEQARGGCLVVTLEPCRHRGRTGPCTEVILASGVSRVVYAVADPTPAGGGAGMLEEAGLSVEPGLLAAEAQPDLLPWLVGVSRQRPHVTWKYAATLDGRTAAADGTSRWISGPEARRDVHRLRLLADAVVVGIGTVLADDPRLTVRDWPADRQPLRVVVDGAARTPTSSNVLDGTAPSLVAVGIDAEPERVKRLRDTAAEVVELPRADGRLDLGALLAVLFDREVRRVLVEGGATLAGSFVRAHLVDAVVGYYAPALLGAGPPALNDAGVTTIAGVIRMDVTDVCQVGADVRITAAVDRRGA